VWVNAFRLLYVHCRREKAEVAAESAAASDLNWQIIESLITIQAFTLAGSRHLHSVYDPVPEPGPVRRGQRQALAVRL